MSKRSTREEIIAKLREVEARLARGETTGQAARSIGVSEQACYRWRKAYGGLQDTLSRIKCRYTQIRII